MFFQAKMRPIWKGCINLSEFCSPWLLRTGLDDPSKRVIGSGRLPSLGKNFQNDLRGVSSLIQLPPFYIRPISKRTSWIFVKVIFLFCTIMVNHHI